MSPNMQWRLDILLKRIGITGNDRADLMDLIATIEEEAEEKGWDRAIEASDRVGP